MDIERRGSDQVEETVKRLVQLYEEHDRSTPPIQKAANRLTNALGRPASVATILMVVINWMVVNYVASRLGYRPLEGFPFPDLAFFATVAVFLTALLILTTQHDQDKLAEKRSHLTLQISLLSERKIAKVIALLEEQRRDSPLLPSRIDPEAAEMARSSDPIEHWNDLTRSDRSRSGRGRSLKRSRQA